MFIDKRCLYLKRKYSMLNKGGTNFKQFKTGPKTYSVSCVCLNNCWRQMTITQNKKYK